MITATNKMNVEFILLSNFHLSTILTKTDKILNKVQLENRERLNKAFLNSPYEALFQLAFIKEEVQLSANLTFWKKFASRFIETLRLTPSIESLREKQFIAAEELFFTQLLSEAPFFQGSEYLNVSCLEYHWNELNK